MSKALEIDYQKISGAASKIRSTANGKMAKAEGNIKKLPTDLTKGFGQTKKAIEKQASAEASMMQGMVKVCMNIAKSLDNVSQSYKNIDKKMSSEMKYQEK